MHFFRWIGPVLLVALSMMNFACMSFHSGALPNEPKGASFVQVAGARVHYVDVEPQETSSSTIVLLHGFASSLNNWTAVIPELQKRHRVIALDLKGFGWTDRPPGDYSPSAQAKMVFALLDERGVDKVSIVGHSWGSSVVLAMAMQQPERVTKIALYDAWVYEEQLPTIFVWSRAAGVGEMLFGLFYQERPEDKMRIAFYDKKFLTEKLVETVHEQLARPGTTAAALAAARGQDFGRMQARYSSVDKPVLLLWGREDRVSTLDVGERLLRDLPNAQLKVYPRCGHFPMIEAASASTRDLVAFLEPETAMTDAMQPPKAPIREVRPTESDDLNGGDDDEIEDGLELEPLEPPSSTSSVPAEPASSR